MADKKKKWTHLRHKVITAIVRPFFGFFSKVLYGADIEPFQDQGDRNYLIVYNHQTAFDQFFVSTAFRGPIYYIATEDIFSIGFLSKLLIWAVAPIPFKKSTADTRAVMNCLRVGKEGGTICVAPEGNRTYSGRTTYIKDSIAPLARKLGMPIAFFKISGGYGVQPRWAQKNRLGKLSAKVEYVLEPEEVKKLSDEELIQIIREKLWVDESGIAKESFPSSHSAEYIERLVYTCPVCGFSKWHSHGTTAVCSTCGQVIEYGSNRAIRGVNRDFPFSDIGQWYDFQEQTVNALDISLYTEKPLFTDTCSFYRVIPYRHKELVEKNASVSLFTDRIVINGTTTHLFDFKDVKVICCCGRNKMNLYHEDAIYQFKGDFHFNAIKYMNLFYHYSNETKGDDNGQFLGL